MKMKLIRTLTLAAGVLALFASGGAGAGATSSASQCHTADRIIQKTIRFQRGRTTAVIKDTVRLCTGHEYKLRASAGQTMNLNLVTGKRTSMTLYSPSGEALLDGGKEWSGDLPETGEYAINIGTDATAAYTLEVTIR